MAAKKDAPADAEPADPVGDELTKINQDAAAAAIAAELAAAPADLAAETVAADD